MRPGAGTTLTTTRLSAVVLAFARGQLYSADSSIRVDSSRSTVHVGDEGGALLNHTQQGETNSGGQGRDTDTDEGLGTFVKMVLASDEGASVGKERHVRIPTIEIIKGLPLHILSSLFVWQQGYHPLPALIRDVETPDAITSGEYVCSAVKLLLALCPTCGAMSSSLVRLDATFMRQLIDSMTMMLLTVSSIAKRNFVSAVSQTTITAKSREAAALLDAVPDCIEVVMGLVSEKSMSNSDINVEAVIDVLQLHPRGEIFVEAALEATRTVIQMLSKRLESGYGCSVFAPTIIAQNAECSLKLIERLFAKESLYCWYLKHDVNGSSLLRIVCSAFELVSNDSSMPPYLRMYDESGGKYFYNAVKRRKAEFYPTDPAGGVAENIVSQTCALLLSLCEHSPWFYDIISAVDEEGKLLADVMVKSFTDILVQIVMRPLLDTHPVSRGESQLTINCLRLGESLTDDSNFKGEIRENLRANLASTFAFMEPQKFKSFWGPGAHAIMLMGIDDTAIRSSSESSDTLDADYWKAARAWKEGGSHVVESTAAVQKMGKEATERGLRYALERTILLAKMVGNLQMQNEGDEEDFVMNMIQFAKNSSPERGAVNNFAKNIKYLYSVATQFGADNPHNYPELMADIELDLAEQVLKAAKHGSHT